MNPNGNGTGVRRTGGNGGCHAMSAAAKELGEALNRLQAKHGRFVLDLDFANVAVLVSQLQLALRDPENTGCNAAIVRGLVDRMIAAIEDAGEPRAAELLRLGDDPDCDVEVRSKNQAGGAGGKDG